MKYVLANDGYVDEIFDIIKQCADNMAKDGLKHWLPYYSKECILRDIHLKQVFVVFNEKDIVATFTLTINKENNLAYLSKLAVVPSKSGSGIGTKCLTYIENYCKEKMINKIVLDVYDKSVRAINFYEKNNYKIVGSKNTRRFVVYIMEKEMI